MSHMCDQCSKDGGHPTFNTEEEFAAHLERDHGQARKPAPEPKRNDPPREGIDYRQPPHTEPKKYGRT